MDIDLKRAKIEAVIRVDKEANIRAKHDLLDLFDAILDCKEISSFQMVIVAMLKNQLIQELGDG